MGVLRRRVARTEHCAWRSAQEVAHVQRVRVRARQLLPCHGRDGGLLIHICKVDKDNQIAFDDGQRCVWWQPQVAGSADEVDDVTSAEEGDGGACSDGHIGLAPEREPPACVRVLSLLEHTCNQGRTGTDKIVISLCMLM